MVLAAKKECEKSGLEASSLICLWGNNIQEFQTLAEKTGLKKILNQYTGYYKEFPLILTVNEKYQYLTCDFWVDEYFMDHPDILNEIFSKFEEKKDIHSFRFLRNNIRFKTHRGNKNVFSIFELLDQLLKEIKNSRIQPGCSFCFQSLPTHLYHFESDIHPLCESCLEKIKSEMKNKKKSLSPLKYLKGTGAAIVMAILVSILNFFLINFGVSSSLVFVLNPLAVLWAYEYFEGPQTVLGIIFAALPLSFNVLFYFWGPQILNTVFSEMKSQQPFHHWNIALLGVYPLIRFYMYSRAWKETDTNTKIFRLS